MKTSLTGYKKNSKDRDEPILEIPSNSISMDMVSHPVISVLDDGSFKVMKPNENYLFNTKSVIEIPMKNKKQKGGLIKDFESYLSSLEEEDQDQVIDYIESLGSDEQEMFLKGGMTMWKKYQQGGNIQTLGNITFDSNKAVQGNYGNLIVTDINTKKDYGVIRKEDGSYDFYRPHNQGNKSTEQHLKDYYKKYINSSEYYNINQVVPLDSLKARARRNFPDTYGPNATPTDVKYVESGIDWDISRNFEKQKLAEIQAIMSIPIKKFKKENPGSHFDIKENAIYLDSKNDSKFGFTDPAVVLAHELSHVKTRAGEENLFHRNYFGNQMYDTKSLSAYINKKSVQTDHDTDPDEYKADINALRYLFWTKGIYDPTKEPFTKEHLKTVKSAKGLNKDKVFQRVQRLSENDDTIIDALNTISQVESTTNNTMAKHGGVFQKGGMTPIEVEHDETILNPNGELYGFNGDTHANGGIDILAEGGSKIFSEYSKAPSELIKVVLGKETKKKMSYADLSKKFDTTKWSKILQNPDSDQYEKETAKLKMSGNLAMLETIFQTQEEEKMKKGKKSEYQYGGPVLPQKKMYTSFWDTRQDREMGKDVEGLTLEQQLTPLQQIKAMYNNLPEVTITGKRPVYPGGSKYDLVVTETEPSTMASSPNRKTSPVYFGNGSLPPATKTLDVVDPNDTSVAPLPFKGNPIKTRTSSQTTQPVSQPVESRSPVSELPTIPSLELPDSLESMNNTPIKIEQVPTTTQTPNTKTSKNLFGIGHKLAGTILDIGLALGDTLTVQNPQYRDLRKSPLFSRFVDFDDKEAGRNLALNIQQIQNSNMPEEVKQARIANLNAQYQDHTAKVAFGNAQRYETKINQDTEKLQTYINNNIDQHFQDVERYNQQKARVDYLKDQFHAQQKSRVVNSIRNYLDYAEETRIKNQLNSENYRVNPITGRIDFLGNKQDALKKKEMEMQQYAQNAVPVKNLPNGAVLARTPQGVEIIIDSTGKATVVKG